MSVCACVCVHVCGHVSVRVCVHEHFACACVSMSVYQWKKDVVEWVWWEKYGRERDKKKE